MTVNYTTEILVAHDDSNDIRAIVKISGYARYGKVQPRVETKEGPVVGYHAFIDDHLTGEKIELVKSEPDFLVALAKVHANMVEFLRKDGRKPEAESLAVVLH